MKLPLAQYSVSQEVAFWRGYQERQFENAESPAAISPYDFDEEAELYEAWQAGYDTA